MTVSVAIQPRPVSDVAPRDSRIERPRPADENADELVAGASGIAFESLLTVTSRVAGATRGRGTEASAATQLFDAPVADAREQRGQAMESDFRSSFDKTPGDERLDRSSVSARLARSAAFADGSPSSAVSRGDASAESAARTTTATASDLQTNELNLSTSPKSDATGDALRRGASSASNANANANGSGAAEPALTARSMTREGGAVAVAVASAVTGKSAATGSAPTGDPAQQIAKILSTGRGGGESARAIDAASTARGGQSANGESRTTNRSTNVGESAEARSAESNTTGEKSSATQRTTPFDELVRSMRLNAGARRSSATLRLEPPELGRLSVEIRINDERAEITVRTETPAARLIVRERVAELTDALERRGIHLERFEVTSEPSDPQTSVFSPGDGSGDATTGSDRQGTDTSERAGHQGSLLGDMGTPPSGATDGTDAVGIGIGVGAEPRLDIKI